MKTALVTGGSGFIGSHLCEALIAKNISVICVDSFITSSKQNVAHLLKSPLFSLVEADVVEDNIEKLIGKTSLDYIFHFASPASPNHHSSISYHALPEQTMEVNTTGTKKMLEMAEKTGARFMFSSTSEVYGDPLVSPQSESYHGNVSTTGPRSVYDEAKRYGETLTAYFQRERGVDTRLIRIFNTYGPRMLKEDKRMIVNFILQGAENKPMTLYGDGTQTRSLCYVDDLIEGILTFMMDDTLSGEIINIGNPEEHTVAEYAQMVKMLMNSTSELKISEKLPEHDPKVRCPDISKAKNLLNWEPRTPIDVGLKKTIAYFKKLN